MHLQVEDDNVDKIEAPLNIVCTIAAKHDGKMRNDRDICKGFIQINQKTRTVTKRPPTAHLDQ